MRHCVWQCYLAKAYGARAAEAVGNVHEAFGMAEAVQQASKAAARAAAAAKAGDAHGAASANAEAAEIMSDAAKAAAMDLQNNVHGRACEKAANCLDCCLDKINGGMLTMDTPEGLQPAPPPCGPLHRRKHRYNK